MSNKDFESWAIVELMGHVRMAGKVAEEEIAGSVLLRIDVPGNDGRKGFTTYVGASAIYRLTPTTEDNARALADWAPDPVQRWDLERRLLPAGAESNDDDDPGYEL